MVFGIVGAVSNAVFEALDSWPFKKPRTLAWYTPQEIYWMELYEEYETARWHKEAFDTVAEEHGFVEVEPGVWQPPTLEIERR
jgi:hypothetical protein